MDRTTTTPNARRCLNDNGSLAAAAFSLSPPAVANMGDIIHPTCSPHPMGIFCWWCFDNNNDDHHDDKDQDDKDNFPSSQGVRFLLQLCNDIDGVDETGGVDDDVDLDDKGGGISEGTIVPGTQLPLYNTIVTPLCHKIAGRKVPDSNLPGIDPNQEGLYCRLVRWTYHRTMELLVVFCHYGTEIFHQIMYKFPFPVPPPQQS